MVQRDRITGSAVIRIPRDKPRSTRIIISGSQVVVVRFSVELLTRVKEAVVACTCMAVQFTVRRVAVTVGQRLVGVRQSSRAAECIGEEIA